MVPLGRNVSYNPLGFFPILLLAHSSIAYGNFGIEAELWIGVFGILLPVLLGLHLAAGEKSAARRTPPFWQVEFLPTVPPAAWVLLILSLGFLHLFGWGRIPSWPLMDEGQFAFYADQFNRTGRTALLLGNVQIEPLFTWILALFFRLFGVSLGTIRLFPALLFLFALGSGYWASRKYFSRSFSFLLLALYGSAFWSQVCSRQCLQSDMVPLFQFLLLGLLGSYSLGKARSQRTWGLLFGSILGAGLYLYTVWPVIIPPTLAILLHHARAPAGSKPRVLRWTLTALVLVSTPMVLARFSDGGMGYIHSILGPQRILWHLAALFFNGMGSVPYGPAWGGLLNSVLASCFWIGVIESFRERGRPLIRWIAFSAPFFLLPEILTRHVEMHRAVLLFPLLMVIAAFGVQTLVQRVSSGPKGRWALTALILAISASLDLYHYSGPFQADRLKTSNPNHWMSVGLARSYRVLQERSQQGENFLLLGHLNNNSKDATFDLAAAPFEKAWTAATGPRWVVLLTNVHYQPFLSGKFPGSHWDRPFPDPPNDDDNLVLFWTPYDDRTRKTLDPWIQADPFFKEMGDEYLYYHDVKSLERNILRLEAAGKEFNKDPFLMAQRGERMALYTFLAPDLDRRQAVKALQEAVRVCPAAHLYDALGMLRLEEGDLSAARNAFETAHRMPLDHTNAMENLRHLPRP
ncbi:MAG TPA: glycosyltransferase family 39 protein [bacterium]|nr:glycosyltransferase family 39 protein [bacterium]